MNETKHTPTPWTVAYGCIYDANGDCVAKADRHESNRLHPVERDENIDFIVETANSHDKLKRDKDMLAQAALALCKLIPQGHSEARIKLGRLARAAIAAAESKD
jgi:hypothetical protein